MTLTVITLPLPLSLPLPLPPSFIPSLRTLVSWLGDADHGGDEGGDADGFERGGGQVTVQLPEVVDGEQHDEHVGHDPQHVEDIVTQRPCDERARGGIVLL